MNILLDTHVLLWVSGAPDKLSAVARDVLMDQSNRLLVSTASVWEIQIKQQLGKLRLDESLELLINAQQKTNGIEILPIYLNHIYALQDLDYYHKDPFDRLLIAQASIEGYQLMSADSAMDLYRDHIKVVW